MTREAKELLRLCTVALSTDGRAARILSERTDVFLADDLLEYLETGLPEVVAEL
jgi:hypothetical protein